MAALRKAPGKTALTAQPSWLAYLPNVHFGQVTAAEDTFNTGEASIPVLDMAEFHTAQAAGDGKAMDAFAQKFGEAFRVYGFIALKNHGIGEAQINDHFKVFNDLMIQGQKDPELLKPYHQGDLDLGYIPGERKPDKTGSYENGFDDPKQMWHTRGTANIYPPFAPEFARQNKQLFHDMRQVGYEVAEILARYVGGDTGDIIRDYVEAGDANPGNVPNNASMMRSIRYFAVPQEEREKFDTRPSAETGKDYLVRTGEHRDMSLFTLLPQATDSGLQLFKREKEFPKGSEHYQAELLKPENWLDVYAQEGYLILNAGDMLDFMTANLEGKHIVATTHRVLASDDNLTRDRNSVPFFFHGNLLKALTDLSTGEPVVRPEKVYEGVPFDTTLQMTYRRLKRAKIVSADTSYDAFKRGFENYAKNVRQVLEEQGLGDAYHAGIPIQG